MARTSRKLIPSGQPTQTKADAIRRRCRSLLRKLGPTARGKFVAIERRTSEAFLGNSSLEAVDAGRRAHPRGIFFIERLGYRAAGTLKRTR